MSLPSVGRLHTRDARAHRSHVAPLAPTTASAGAAAGPAIVAGDYGTVLGEYDFNVTANITSAATLVSSVTAKTGSYGAIVQAADANKPKTGTRLSPTGLNVLDFDGTDVLSLDTADQAQPITLVAVCACDTTGSSNMQVLGNATPTTQPCVIVWTGVFNMFATAFVVSSVAQDTAWHVHVAIFNGGSSQYYIDGALVGSGSPGATTFIRAVVGDDFGGGYGWDGGIAHVIYYNGVVASPGTLSTALKSRWGTV